MVCKIHKKDLFYLVPSHCNYVGMLRCLSWWLTLCDSLEPPSSCSLAGEYWLAIGNARNPIPPHQCVVYILTHVLSRWTVPKCPGISWWFDDFASDSNRTSTIEYQETKDYISPSDNTSNIPLLPSCPFGFFSMLWVLFLGLVLVKYSSASHAGFLYR